MQSVDESWRRSGATYFDKVWQQHTIHQFENNYHLVHVDRLLLHELTSYPALKNIESRTKPVKNPQLVYSFIDHIVDTTEGRTRNQSCLQGGSNLISFTRSSARRHGFRLFDSNDSDQGIAHIVAAETGIALPALTIVCGDSHTCTLGGLGAIAWGVGTSDLEQGLMYQSLIKKKPAVMRIKLEDTPPRGVFAKDLIMHVIGKIGANGGVNHAVEYGGSCVSTMSVEERMTLCNMSIEFSAMTGFIAPDDTTCEYLANREYAPSGQHWDLACRHWQQLASDDDAVFDQELTLSAQDVTPQISWGTNPAQVIGIDDPIPGTDPFEDPDQHRKSLDYMQLESGTQINQLPIDVAYIGSCTNARLEDLRIAASILKGRKVSQNITAICVPGSMRIKKAAEREGIDQIFKQAGFEWHLSGCGLCANMGNTRLFNRRVISTTNRSFENRQGVATRTHIASPATVAASAIRGRISDPRPFLPCRI